MTALEDYTSESVVDIDMVVHIPVRLAILSILDGQNKADFQFLLRVLGVTKGNLSAHLSKLAAAELIEVSKIIEEGTPRTMQRITPKGREALANYWVQMEMIRSLSHS